MEETSLSLGCVKLCSEAS